MSTVEVIFTYGVGPLITIYGTWVAVRMKQKREQAKAQQIARQSELDNVEKVIKIWSGTAERLEKKLEDRESKIVELEKQLDEIFRQNKLLISKLEQLEKDYNQLEKNYKELKKEFSK